jgi:hypothetical protein
MRVYQIITNYTMLKLQLLSVLDLDVRIFFCPQVIDVKIDDAISVQTRLFCEEH